MKFCLKVPATSANLGPGFDTLGVALSLFLTVEACFKAEGKESCLLELEGEGKAELATDPEVNLITRTALYVLRSLGRAGFGGELRLKITNAIPLGRGLGSSGAAVVCGVLLANVIGGFEMPVSRLLDFIIAVERHPDNVVPCLVGGLVASYVRNSELEVNPMPNGSSAQLTDVPNSETLSDHHATVRLPRSPPQQAVSYIKLPVHQSIKAVVVIPAYPVPTAKARDALPSNYPKADVVYNLQRLAVLTHALGEAPPSPDRIFGAMRDKLHQPYRHHLVPGLNQALEALTPTTCAGLLGICLSGAGPTVLAFVTANFERVGASIKRILDERGGTACQVLMLDIFTGGSEVLVEGEL